MAEVSFSVSTFTFRTSKPQLNKEKGGFGAGDAFGRLSVSRLTLQMDRDLVQLLQLLLLRLGEVEAVHQVQPVLFPACKARERK